MKLRIALLAAAVALLVAALSLRGSSDPRGGKPHPNPPRLELDSNSEGNSSQGLLDSEPDLHYRLTSRCDVAWKQEEPGEGTAGISLSVDGTLRMQVVERRGDGFRMELELRSPTVTVGVPGRGNASSEELAKALACEVLVDCTRRGALVAWHLPSDRPPSVRNMLRSLLAPAIIVRPQEPILTWTMEEEDLLGRYVATYECRATDGPIRTVAKRKRYTDLHNGAEVTATVEGEGILRVDTREDRLISLESREKIALAGSAGGIADGELEYRLKLLKVMAGRTPHRSEGLVTLHGGKPEPTTGADFMRPKRIYPDKSPAEVLELVRIAAKEGKFDEEASRVLLDLEALLTNEPAQIPAVIRMLKDGERSREESSLLAMALAGSAQPAAIEELRAIAAESGPARRAAVEALGFAPGPGEASSVRLLRDLAQVGEEAVRSAALQSLGLLSSSAKSPDAREQAGRALLDLRPSKEADPQEWLVAVGNGAPRGGLEAILPYTLHEDERIRAEAIRALRHYDDESARTTLARCVREDPSLIVRNRAERALAERNP